MKISIINGPNLNLLGEREPEIYGNKGFDEFLKKLKKQFPNQEFSYFQSNAEGDLVNALQECRKTADGVVLNAAAYTHTSVAIADAVRALEIPVIEVHISNVFQREAFRHHSFIAPYAKGVIAGFGLQSYELAVRSLIDGQS